MSKKIEYDATLLQETRDQLHDLERQLEERGPFNSLDKEIIGRPLDTPRGNILAPHKPLTSIKRVESNLDIISPDPHKLITQSSVVTTVNAVPHLTLPKPNPDIDDISKPTIFGITKPVKYVEVPINNTDPPNSPPTLDQKPIKSSVNNSFEDLTVKFKGNNPPVSLSGEVQVLEQKLETETKVRIQVQTKLDELLNVLKKKGKKKKCFNCN